MVFTKTINLKSTDFKRGKNIYLHSLFNEYQNLFTIHRHVESDNGFLKIFYHYLVNTDFTKKKKLLLYNFHAMQQWTR